MTKNVIEARKRTALAIKKEALECARELLRIFSDDIETGVEDGTYKEEDNKENFEFIVRSEKAFNNLENYKPTVY